MLDEEEERRLEEEEERLLELEQEAYEEKMRLQDLADQEEKN